MIEGWSNSIRILPPAWLWIDGTAWESPSSRMLVLSRGSDNEEQRQQDIRQGDGDCEVSGMLVGDLEGHLAPYDEQAHDELRDNENR